MTKRKGLIKDEEQNHFVFPISWTVFFQSGMTEKTKAVSSHKAKQNVQHLQSDYGFITNVRSNEKGIKKKKD